MKKFYALAIAFFAFFSAFAQQIKLEDVVNYAYYARSVRGLQPYADGVSYTRISDDGNQILRCSYKSGETLEVLADRTAARVVDAQGNTVSGVRAADLPLSSYTFSPDGKAILIATDVEAIYRRSSRARYYIYNIHNKTFTPLSKNGPQEVPRFSPDGTMVAFVRDGNLFLVKLLFNNAETQVTQDGEFNHIINGKPDWVYEEEFEYNCAYDFSSDSQLLAWVRFDESQVKTFSMLYFKGAAPEMQDNALYPSVYSYKYPKAGEVNSQVSVHSYDIKSRVTRTLNVPLEKDGYIPRIQRTCEKDQFAVVTLNRRQNQCDIYSVNARSGVSKLMLRETNDRYIEVSFYDHLDFSQRQFVVLSERDGFRHLYLYNLDGSLVRQLTQGNYVVNDYYGTDGQCFFYASTDEMGSGHGNPLEQYIYKVDAKGKKTLLTERKGFNSAAFPGLEGGRGGFNFVNTWSDLTTPPVAAVYTSAGKQERVLEDNATLKEEYDKYLKIAKPELFQFTTSEGATLNGWMVKPADFDASRKYPVIMYQYSGPGDQQVHNSWNNGNARGLIWEHRLAQKGYIVACVDGRGTGGRGADFQKCTYMTMGDKESKDQVETALYLGSLPYVDKDRIGIWGWSFGGFNTIMSMSEGRGVFRCGVAVAPVTDWRFYDSAYTERYMRTPQENPDGYDISPLHRFQKLHGDLLICHGLADDNVHYQNTAELTEQMVQAGIQFEEQIYTNRNHGIYGGNTRLHLFRRIEGFFDRHLLP
ncbi:MAG: DPP IV N-terminal domain-containing protein [Bacteroidaceae bacterium]|nr:DPP IV N-terminal domain-containing protein [Bacteroidaceae bacterium]